MAELGIVEGFDVGLEMSGSADAFRSLLANMNNGGRVSLLGIPPITRSDIGRFPSAFSGRRSVPRFPVSSPPGAINNSLAKRLTIVKTHGQTVKGHRQWYPAA